MGFALLYENFADQGVMSGSGWATPVTNLQDTDINLAARSLGADAASVTLDLGTARPIGGFAVGPTNMSPGATYRGRAYDNPTMTGAPSYDTGLRTLDGNAIDWASPAAWLEWEDTNFWLGIVPTDSPELPLYLLHLVPPGQAGAAIAQFWRFDFANPGNPDGYLSIGRLLLARAYRPSINYGYDGNDFGIDPLTDITESLGGSESFWDRGMRRTFRAAWQTLPESELFETWVRIALRARTSRQVFVIPEEADTSELMRRRAFLARFKATPRIAQTLFQRGASAIDLQEVL